MVEQEHHRFIWDQDQTPLGQPHSDTYIRSYVQKNQDFLLLKWTSLSEEKNQLVATNIFENFAWITLRSF